MLFAQLGALPKDEEGWVHGRIDRGGASPPPAAPSGGALTPGNPMARAPAGGALSMEPMGETAPGAPPAPSGSALSPEQTEDITEEMSPEERKRIFGESAEAAKNTSPEDKEKINTSLEEAFGPGSVEKSYSEILERLGGKEVVGDIQLTKQDWGLFMMDFGLRLMAYSGDHGVGTAIGKAGADTIGAIQGHKRGIHDQAAKTNESRERAALSLTEMQAKGADKANILWTTKGAWDNTTGQYVRDRQTGDILQPGMEPGATNKPFAKEWEINDLVSQGWSDDAARAMAGGAMNPAQVAGLALETVERLRAAGERITINGRSIRANKATEEEIQQYVDNYVQRYTGYYEYKPGQQGGALTQPGPQAEGRQ